MTAFRPAERILLKLGIQNPKDIDLEAIAWTLGAAVRYRPMEKCEATIVGSSKHAIISVNANSISKRQRFSIAHEIGHWHHHRGRVLFCGKEDIGNPGYGTNNPEMQADQFASDLILPNYLFQPLVAKITRPTLSTIREIAAEFSASDTATLRKLVGTNQFPVLIVCHNMNGRRWFNRPPSMKPWWFPREELDPDSFAFDMLFGNANESNYPRKVGADAWFNFQGAGRFEVQEQSFSLPNRELMTLLTLPDEAME